MLKKNKNIEVAVRMRPLLDNYQDHQSWIANSQSKTISSIPRKTLSNNMNISNISNNEDSALYIKRRPSSILQKNNVYQFSYDYVFSQEQRNSQVYNQSCKKIVQQFTNGNNASIFMYGQTTSGKTYTMLGSQKQQGLIVFSLKQIFNRLSSNNSQKFPIVKISYMEIYNEQINDLLNPEGLNLKFSEESVMGLSQYQIFEYQDAINLLQEGQKLRSYGEKSFHDHSSRSHTIFQIKLFPDNYQAKKNSGKSVLNLVDLAGSERVGEDEANQETGYINKSLFVLSNVVHKLSQKKSGHIPFRDSKLTRVLSSSLTTSSFTIFICTISPAEINFTQTLSTLRFANQSRKVELKAIQDSSLLMNESSFIDQRKQISKLKEENLTLKKNLSEKSKHEGNHAALISQKSNIQLTLSKLMKLIQEGNKQNCQNNKYKGLVSSIRHGQTERKLQNLCLQYNHNIKNLENEYIKAMINLTSTQMNIPKPEIKRRLLEEQL